MQQCPLKIDETMGHPDASRLRGWHRLPRSTAPYPERALCCRMFSCAIPIHWSRVVSTSLKTFAGRAQRPAGVTAQRKPRVDAVTCWCGWPGAGSNRRPSDFQLGSGWFWVVAERPRCAARRPVWPPDVGRGRLVVSEVLAKRPVPVGPCTVASAAEEANRTLTTCGRFSA